MPYSHHVFISYQRAPTIAFWVERYFVPCFEEWLKQKAGATAKVYLDVAELKTGDKWRERLGTALLQSCVLVPILSPSYFESRYCWAELLTFQAREELLPRGRSELVVPALACRGDNIPRSVLDSQYLDFSRYVTKSDSFETWAAYKDFEELIQKLAGHVVDKLRKAPPHSDAWPVVDPEDPQVLNRARECAAALGIPLLAA